MRFQNAEFVKSVFTKEDLPSMRMPEIAVVGRSNVGKSSLLNDLFGKKLAKTSSTPGKTKSINFFLLDKRILFVDLPGYGFATGCKEEKVNWGTLTDSYLKERDNLAVLLFLLDIRRIPSKEDLAMLEWIKSQNIPTILVLTKADKLSSSEKEKQTKEILNGIKDLKYVHYSALKKEGRSKLISLILEHLK